MPRKKEIRLGCSKIKTHYWPKYYSFHSGRQKVNSEVKRTETDSDERAEIRHPRCNQLPGRENMIFIKFPMAPSEIGNPDMLFWNPEKQISDFEVFGHQYEESDVIFWIRVPI